MDLAKINAQFSYQNQVKLIEGNGGLPQVSVKNAAASAEIMLLGAHLISFIPANGSQLIWLSKATQFKDGVPIRGGIPVCWPWFGKNEQNPELPMHGFARQVSWELTGVQAIADNKTVVVLTLKDSPESRKLWDFAFEVQAIFTISDYLSVELITFNRDTRPFVISQGIHTYFQLKDIETIAITGFDGKDYLDKVGGANDIKTMKGTVTVHEEIDGVFKNAPGPFAVTDPLLKRAIAITTEGSNSAVIWNPWKERSKVLPDYLPTAYLDMVCVETCNALEDARTVEPGQAHAIKATYTISQF